MSERPRTPQVFAERPSPLAEDRRSRLSAEPASIRMGDARLASSGRGALAAPAEVAARPSRTVLTVGQLTRQIKGTLERGFTRVIVKGEISGYRGPNVRGHLYFNLKDADATLEAKIWASMAARMKFKLREGLSVVAEGSIDLYEPAGRYSLVISKIEPEGEGALALAFAQLKEQLAAEGLIGENRRRAPRPIPFLPRRIGLVTSRTGAALQDFLRVLHQRNRRLSVLLCDARVQGEGAADEVVRAIRWLSKTDVDVIVVTRGGGSIEDLWTFNEESVARAIFASPIPVISAIGHEVDFTIADFVADLRCPTPSAAAEKLSPVLADLELQLRTAARRLQKAAERKVLEDRHALERLRGRLADPRRVLGQKQRHLAEQADRMVKRVRAAVRLSREKQRSLAERLNRQQPQARLALRRRELGRLKERLLQALREKVRGSHQSLTRLRVSVERASPRRRIQQEHHRLAQRRARLVESTRRTLSDSRREFREDAAALEAMSPLKVLARGYSVTFRADDGHLVRSAADVVPGEAITIRLASGDCDTLDECDRIEARVTASSPGKREDAAGSGEENSLDSAARTGPAGPSR